MLRRTIKKEASTEDIIVGGITLKEKEHKVIADGKKVELNLSLPDIGKEFNRDHSTILYGIRKVEVALKEGDQQLQDNIRDITANINSCL